MLHGNSKYLLLCILFLISSLGIAQQKEELIYDAIDAYIENTNPQTKLNLSQHIAESSGIQDKDIDLAVVIAYCNLAYIEAQNFQNVSAIDYYEKARDLFFEQNLSDYDIVEYALKPLGNLYVKTQSYAKAEHTIKHYLLLAQESSDAEQELSAVINLSALYNSQSKFQASVLILEEALRKHPNHAILQTNLASSLMALGAWDKLEEMASSLPKTIETYKVLARVQLEQKNYEAAIQNLNLASDLIQAKNVYAKADLELAIAEIYYIKSDKEKAYKQLEKAYEILNPDFDINQILDKAEQFSVHPLELQILDTQARWLYEDGDNEGSLYLYEIAQDLSEQLLQKQTHKEDKIPILSQAKDRIENLLAILYEIYQNTQEETYLEKALYYFQLNYNRLTYEELNRKEILMQNNPKLLQELSEKQLALDKLLGEINLAFEQNEELNLIESLQRKYNQDFAALQSLYTQIDVQESFESIDLGDLKELAALDKATRLLYFYGKNTAYQMRIESDKVDFIKLTNTADEFESLNNTLKAFIHLFDLPETINNDVEKFKSLAFEVYKILQIPKAEELILIPDAILSYVAFQALLTQETQVNTYENMPFLIYETSLTYHTNLLQSFSTEEFEVSKVLGVFPVFRNTTYELKASIEEAEVLKKYLSTKNLMENEASKDNFLDLLQDYKILHLSSHALGGTFKEEATIQFADEFMYLSELYPLYINPDLVVLSACETGVGRLIKGEGAQSMAKAFQAAGAKNVLFSLWEVNDKSTSLWMEKFYASLVKTKSRNASVRDASLAYLQDKNIANAAKSPFYWSAFVYYGQKDSIISENHRSLVYIGFTGVFILLIIGLFINFFKKRVTKK